ncbi:dehydrogenase [Streptomyces sp. NPDC047968]|uniref:dehydrogenase n=1 Tax=unclassified Streptomyces TaxID=2593676 RepID=UPI0034290919
MSVSPSTPAGQWAGTVTHDGEVDDYTVTFQEDGSLVVVTKKSTGAGSWAATGDDTFTFFLREDFNTDVTQISPTGFRAAYIKIDFEARLEGDGTFTGKGKAVVHDTHDKVIYATDARTDAHRVP